MPVLSEGEVLPLIDGAKRVFLLEPDYERKYPPLALMKIAARVRGQGGRVKFARNYLGEKCDLICVTSLFTYESPTVVQAVRQALDLANGVPVLVGGIYASLMRKHLEKKTSSAGEALIFTGYSQALDQVVPDYSINCGVEEPWDEFSFTFTSRGCVNKCAYCAVHRVEPGQWVNPGWREHVVDGKPCAMISDNNLPAAPLEHVLEVLRFLAGSKKQVIFDNGFDCKFITPEIARLLAKVRYTRHGMRLAFDRIEEDGTFQKAVEVLKRAGVPQSQTMAYVLFNFADSPREADYRMRECRRIGIRPYPQKFQKLNQTNRLSPYVGKRWTRRLSQRFRYFWLMAGLNTKLAFDEWIRRQVRLGKASEEDLAAWDVGRDEWEPRSIAL